MLGLLSLQPRSGCDESDESRGVSLTLVGGRPAPADRSLHAARHCTDSVETARGADAMRFAVPVALLLTA